MKELSREQLGKRIHRIRLQQNLTREQFAEQVSISPQFLAEIENGKKGMSTDTLFKICSRFNLSADYILFGRTSSTPLADPIQNTLNAFPTNYIELTEEIISAIERTLILK